MDIDPDRLDQSRQIVQAIAEKRKLPTRIEATTDRAQALRGTDYRQLHDAFGGINKCADLSGVMKELIQIQEKQTLGLNS
jgi:alpha-galactosidase/6-phospho-beta-glucosidase family protein